MEINAEENPYLLEEKILRKSISLHDEAIADWRLLYRYFYPVKDEPRNKFNESIVRQASMLIKLNFTATFRQRSLDTSTLNEVVSLELMLAQLLKTNHRSISTFLEDGLITNHGVLRIGYNHKSKKAYLSRIDPLSIARYLTKDKTEYVIDRKEHKIWTVNKIYILDENNTKIIKTEKNTADLIPFVFFSPFRIDENSTDNSLQNYREYQSQYGLPNIELYNLNRRFQYNREQYSNATHNALRPSALASVDETFTESQYDDLMTGGTVIQMNNPNSGLVVKSSVTNETMNILAMNESNILKELDEYTGLNETTLGATTRTMSASALREIKEATSIISQPYEEEYKDTYEEIARKTTKITILFNPSMKITKEEVDTLDFEKYNKSLDPQEKITVIQSINQLILQLGITPASLKLMDTMLTPLIAQISQTAGVNPALITVNTKEAFNSLHDELIKQQQQQQQMLEAQQQQLLAQQQPTEDIPNGQ